MASQVNLDGSTLSASEVYRVAKDGLEISISDDAWTRIVASRKVVEDVLDSGKVVYGINTGFGALVNTTISKENLNQLQINLVRSHATGLGDNMSKIAVRSMMISRINSFARGFSGVNPNIVQQLLDFVNLDITPLIPRIGSLGASGDLAPLSHMALTLIGEGYVMDEEGNALETKSVLIERGLIPVELSAKDGLSLINGTSQMLSYSILSLNMLSNLLPIADIVYCTSLDGFQGSIKPADERVHDARPHRGQVLIASRIRQIMDGSDILKGHKDCSRVQDPYSFRCAPQVHGAVYEAYLGMKDTIHTELNSSTDNPLVFPGGENSEAEIISQGNFHGEVLALCADRMSLSIFELGSISERRMDQLLDARKSGLPPFLAVDSGLESGMMIVQYSAGSSLAEMHGHASPRSSFSTSTSAGQEDHVSMGATACWNLYQACIRLSEVIACELIIACESLEHNPLQPSQFVQSLYKLVRTISPKLTNDRSTSEEIMEIAKTLREGTWVSRIEAENDRLIR